jgi:hypothetical protein
MLNEMTKAAKENPKSLILDTDHPPINVLGKDKSEQGTKRTRKVKPESEEDGWTEPGKIGEREEKCTLEDTIQFINECLETTFNEFLDYPRLKAVLDVWLPNGSFGDFRHWFIGNISSGQITNETIADWWHACIFRTGEDADIGMLWSTFTYSILAQRALQHGERDKGWALAARASYYCGLSQSVVALEFFMRISAHRDRSFR